MAGLPKDLSRHPATAVKSPSYERIGGAVVAPRTVGWSGISLAGQWPPNVQSTLWCVVTPRHVNLAV